MSVQTMSAPVTKPSAISGFHVAFVVAWAVCLSFYFTQYAVRSAPSVMLPELTQAFGLTTLGMSSLLGMYYYTYSTSRSSPARRSIAGAPSTQSRPGYFSLQSAS